jgi:hypothetical protein
MLIKFYTQDLVRKNELMEKNFNSENKQLRGKIHSLEQEAILYKERALKLARDVKEKDKEVASLSIYRYNAIHRKGELANCKICTKRDKDEEEKKRREAITARLPVIQMPNVEIVEARSIKIDLIVPVAENQPASTPSPTKSSNHLFSSRHAGRSKSVVDSSWKRSSDMLKKTPEVQAPNTVRVGPAYTHIFLRCSPDPTFSVQESILEARFEASLFVTKQNTIADAKDITEQYFPPSDTVQYSHSFKGLKPNVYYYVKVFAQNGDIVGPATEHSILCDLVPSEPALAPACQQFQHERSIKIKMEKIPQTAEEESLVSKYQVYHSLSSDMSEKFLVGEIVIPEGDEFNATAEFVEFLYKGAEVMVDHFFSFSGANRCGEGPISKCSSAIRVGNSPI